MFAFCLINIRKLLTIRTNSEMEEMFAYLRLHKENQPNLRKVIKAELSKICKDFKMNQSGLRMHQIGFISKTKRFNY